MPVDGFFRKEGPNIIKEDGIATIRDEIVAAGCCGSFINLSW